MTNIINFGIVLSVPIKLDQIRARKIQVYNKYQIKAFESIKHQYLPKPTKLVPTKIVPTQIISIY